MIIELEEAPERKQFENLAGMFNEELEGLEDKIVRLNAFAQRLGVPKSISDILPQEPQQTSLPTDNVFMLLFDKAKCIQKANAELDKTITRLEKLA